MGYVRTYQMLGCVGITAALPRPRSEYIKIQPTNQNATEGARGGEGSSPREAFVATGGACARFSQRLDGFSPYRKSETGR